MDSNSRYKQS